MPSLQDFRLGKPGYYPDQSVYAEYACSAFGLAFLEIDGSNLPVAAAGPFRAGGHDVDTVLDDLEFDRVARH